MASRRLGQWLDVQGHRYLRDPGAIVVALSETLVFSCGSHYKAHMESAHFDPRARKRTVSLTLNGDLYAQAKAAGINASRVAEAALAQALKARRAEALAAEIRQDREALARYVAEHGDPAAELRELFASPDAT